MGVRIMSKEAKAMHGPSVDIEFYKRHHGDNWREVIAKRKQVDSFGNEVLLAPLTEKVLWDYAHDVRDKERYKKTVASSLMQYKYYNALDPVTLHMFSETFVKEKGWRVPNE